MLAWVVRWAPTVILLTSVAAVVLGLFAVSHDAAEVQLLGASLVLGTLVFTLLALTFVLFVREAIARWGGSGSTSAPRPPCIGDG